jgi:hypothetical protein
MREEQQMSIDFDWEDDNVADEVYHILCGVGGGLTGFRSAILKENGEVAVFYSYEEAKAKADELNKKMNSNPYTSVIFDYSVIEG